MSQPDKEVGRHHKLQKTPIKELAESYDIPVFQPEKIKNDNEQIKTWKTGFNRHMRLWSNHSRRDFNLC